MGRAVIARDGLVARDNGPWGETKLSFLDYYCPSAIQATARKHQRYYIDLFAGPGRNVVRGRGNEFDGSPLRVLRYQSQGRLPLAFTHAVFLNANRKDHEALKERVRRAASDGASRIPKEDIHCVNGDANIEIAGILGRIPREAYLMVFADMEAPSQWPWHSMCALRTLGHRSVDLYTLLPLDMAIVRLISYQRNQRERHATTLDQFFGTGDWRRLADRRLTEGQAGEMRHGLTELYLNQLRTLWQNAGPMIDVFLRGQQRLYRMLFASDHPAADRIASWIKHNTIDGAQGSLFG